MRKIVFAVSLLTLAALRPLSAGTVYVPIAQDVTADGERQYTEVWISNTGIQSQTAKTLFLETNTDGTVRGKRQTEFGYDVIEAPLPAVVAVSDAINEPRYPSLKGIMGAKKKPQETLSGADLGLDGAALGEQGSGTTVLALGDPPPRGEARKIEDDGNAAQQVVEFLAERKLL